MNPEEPRIPHDEEEPAPDATSDTAETPDSSADTLITPPPGGPPRVVAETPVGGRPPALWAPGAHEVPPAAEETEPVSEPEPAAEDLPAATDAEGLPAVEAEQATVSAEAPPAESEPDEEAIPASEQELHEDAVAIAGTERESEASSEAEPEEDTSAEPEVESAVEPAGAVAEEVMPEIAEEAPAPDVDVPDLEAPVSVVRAAMAAAADEPQEHKSAPVAAAEPEESLVGEGEWDDDLSPALAAVLFGSPRRPPAEAALETTPAADVADLAVAPQPRAAHIAGPIRLTEEAEARTLPITAGEHAAPAPDAALAGKVRYTHLEEPLKGDRGQRVVETWSYFKPDYPGLEGQLVRAVRSEETRYSDGSWRWRYERQYADRGRDRRDISANAERTYFERVDEVAQRDPLTGKRKQVKEEEGMIFAPPPREDKRGLLSSLLRRVQSKPEGPPAWRAATSGEMRQARNDGGQAFKRGLFG